MTSNDEDVIYLSDDEGVDAPISSNEEIISLSDDEAVVTVRSDPVPYEEAVATIESDPVPKKRRKRAREEIEQEKLAKEIARIQREANTAKNSKCEQYLYCYLSADILKLEDSLEAKLLSLFQERQIVEQLHVEDELSPMHISWRRKVVNAVVENGKVTRTEAMGHQELQGILDCQHLLLFPFLQRGLQVPAYQLKHRLLALLELLVGLWAQFFPSAPVCL
ncbi:hypothetical protein QR680_011379 [Steinernema hermaphroditum]|uniref:Uncharacterized protein n=1 Tax=Steinernema hermaphroditum TaxID=289476 RepID=A0AA39ITX4_9BILA|nr:hypothetical protein QR680_011379 [Steinernema hermaphroditum]